MTGSSTNGSPAGRRAAALPAGGTRDITAIPRAVISAAVEVVHTVERAVGAGPARTARDNAWEAVCADRARALHQAEVRRAIAALTERPVATRRRARTQRSVGSSPRSSAVHA